MYLFVKSIVASPTPLSQEGWISVSISIASKRCRLSPDSRSRSTLLPVIRWFPRWSRQEATFRRWFRGSRISLTFHAFPRHRSSSRDDSYALRMSWKIENVTRKRERIIVEFVCVFRSILFYLFFLLFLFPLYSQKSKNESIFFRTNNALNFFLIFSIEVEWQLLQNKIFFFFVFQIKIQRFRLIMKYFWILSPSVEIDTFPRLWGTNKTTCAPRIIADIHGIMGDNGTI